MVGAVIFVRFTKKCNQMEKDHYVGLLVLFIIVAIVAFGGGKNAKNASGFFNFTLPQETEEQKINDAKNKALDLAKQLQTAEDVKIQSQYKGLVSIQYVNHSNNANSEYIALNMSGQATTTAPITGWQIKSLSSGTSVTIPLGALLYFSGTTNSESPIVLYPGDIVYISTGVSPNGYSFRLNKCSGYLSQFQTFIPYISTNCPSPRNEDLSSIPPTVNNDSCFDYIDSYPSCRTQSTDSGSLPANLSPECVKFIYNKLNYSSCVDTHKNDPDFYVKEWRVFLKRNAPIWKNEREDIVLYDNGGKIVSELKY